MTDTMNGVPELEWRSMEIDTSELHDAMLRTVADLHAAYGAGVIFEVQDAKVGELRNFLLSDGIPTDDGGNALIVGLWEEGEATVATYAQGLLYKAVVAPGALPVVIDNARAFLHTFGSGAR